MKQYYRSREDQKLGGVIGGLAEYFQVDANLLRLATIFLCFLTAFFPLVATYFIAWILIPESSTEHQASGSATLAASGNKNA